jgi:hypothetical protein
MTAMSDGKNDNANPDSDPAVDLDAHRGLKGRKETAQRRQRSDVRADQNAVRDSQASLEKHLFAGPATTWLQAAEKTGYLLRLFAQTADAQDPRYKKLIAEALDDLTRLAEEKRDPAS